MALGKATFSAAEAGVGGFEMFSGATWSHQCLLEHPHFVPATMSMCHVMPWCWLQLSPSCYCAKGDWSHRCPFSLGEGATTSSSPAGSMWEQDICWDSCRQSKGLLMLCLKANCRQKSSSTGSCCSSQAASPCSATPVSSRDMVAVPLGRESAGTQGHRLSLGDAKPSQRRAQRCRRQRALPICCPWYHPPAAQVLPTAKNMPLAVL